MFLIPYEKKHGCVSIIGSKKWINSKQGLYSNNVETVVVWQYCQLLDIVSVQKYMASLLHSFVTLDLVHSIDIFLTPGKSTQPLRDSQTITTWLEGLYKSFYTPHCSPGTFQWLLKFCCWIQALVLHFASLFFISCTHRQNHLSHCVLSG